MMKRTLPHPAPMTEKERFADLVGAVTPLKTPPQAEDFGKQAKILQRRRIEAQRIRHSADPQETRHNLAAIPDARFHALCAGRLPVAREIDLHGFFVDEALRYLGDMLDCCPRQGAQQPALRPRPAQAGGAGTAAAPSGGQCARHHRR